MKVQVREAPVEQPSLYEVVREEVHASGPVQRAWLQERVRRRSRAERDQVVSAVDDLLRSGDLLAGHGLVGPAPLRAVPLPGGGALLVGSRPRRFLPDGVPDDLVRRVADAPPQATTVALERWTGIDRAPVADEDFLESLGGAEVVDDGEDWALAYGWREGRFRPSVPEGPGLWRLRMPGGWFRYAWADDEGRHRLTTDEGLRAAFALQRLDDGTVVQVHKDDGDRVTKLPRLPRPEYRLVIACGRRRDDWYWCIPEARWSEVASVLSQQLGLRFEEVHGKA